MDKQLLERRLREYADGACVISTTQFAKFYGISVGKASAKLHNANVDRVCKKWFIPDLADKICKNLM